MFAPSICFASAAGMYRAGSSSGVTGTLKLALQYHVGGAFTYCTSFFDPAVWDKEEGSANKRGCSRMMLEFNLHDVGPTVRASCFLQWRWTRLSIGGWLDI